MKSSSRTILIVLAIPVLLAGGLYCYLVVEQARRTQEILYDIHDAEAVSVAFSTALRTNDRMAYELADSSLEEKIDAWMQTHRVYRCDPWEVEDTIFASVFRDEYTVEFSCYTRSSGVYTFILEDILLAKDETGQWRVLDWARHEERID